MGQRISLRGRTHGLLRQSPRVGDPDYDETEIPWITRFDPYLKFVKGTLSGTPEDGEVEVGEGTDYPMKVTLDQMMKIFYRVKDAKIVSGLYTIKAEETWTAGEDTDTFVNVMTLGVQEGATGTKRTNAFVVTQPGMTDGDYTVVTARGLTTVSTDSPPTDLPEEDAVWFEEGYSVTAGDVDYKAYDIGDNERAIWMLDEDLKLFWQNLAAPGNSFVHHGAFIFRQSGEPMGFGEGQTIPSHVNCITTQVETFYYSGGILTYESNDKGANEVIVTVMPSVAVAGADDPLNPDAELYIKLNVLIRSFFASTGSAYDVLTKKDETEIDLSTNLGFVLDLGEGIENPRAKLYVYDVYYTGVETYEEITSEDFTMKALLWWPYAKNDGAPLWDSLTGAKL